MLLVLALAALALSCAALIRRAAPAAIGSGVGVLIWTMTRDPWATCAAGFLALCLAAGILDALATSGSRCLRASVVGAELLAAIAVSVWLAFSVAHEFVSPTAVVLISACACLLGVGLVLRRRMQTH